MEPARSDWSNISEDDLITIHQAFEGGVENDDGTYSIYLSAVHWSKCLAVMGKIGDELRERDERRDDG